jgi:hypothetical protein
MAIRELVDQVRSQVSSEDLEKVGVLLETIKNEATVLQEKKAAVDTESKDRRLKNRELEQTNETLIIERDEWKNKFESHDDTEIKQERDQYKNKYTELLKGQKTAFVGYIEKVKDDPRFENVKDEYHFPEKKDDKYDWESLSDEHLESNIAKANYHQKIEYFNVPADKPNPPTGKTRTVDGVSIPSVEECEALKQKYGSMHPQYIAAVKLRRENRET